MAKLLPGFIPGATAWPGGTDSDPEQPVVLGGIYAFETPVVYEKYGTHGLFGRISQARGLTVLKVGTSYRSLSDPSPELITSADRVYLGGRLYEIDGVEATALLNAGYGAWLTELFRPPPNSGPTGYGLGGYGSGPYGVGGPSGGGGIVLPSSGYGNGAFGVGNYGT